MPDKQTEAELFMGYGAPQPDGGHWGKFFTSRHNGTWFSCPLCNPHRNPRAALIHPVILGDGVTELPVGTIGEVLEVMRTDVRIRFQVDGEEVVLLLDVGSVDREDAQ